MISITRFSSLTASTEGQVLHLDGWATLVALLSVPLPSYQGHLKHPGWSPATFRGGHRAKADVESVSLLVVEHDQGTVQGEEAVAFARSLGLRALVLPTKSSKPAAPRWRLIFDLSRPCTVEERAQLWTWAARELAGLQLQAAESRDAARFWYWPCPPAEGAHEVLQCEGEALDVDAIVGAEDEPQSVIAPPPRPTPTPRSERSEGKGYLEAALLDAQRAIRGATKGERHNTVSKEAYSIGGLVGGGYLSSFEASAALVDAVPRSWEPAEQADARRTIAGQLQEGAKAPRTVAPATRGSAAVAFAPSSAPPEVEAPKLRLASPDDDPRPAIEIGKGSIPRMTDQAVDALSKAQGDLYTREGELVHVAAVTAEEAKGSPFPVGSPKIHTLGIPGLTERLARAARWVKRHEPADPPPMVVAAVLARKKWPGLRPLAGIIDAPTMRPDGSLLTEPGYDAPTRTLYTPSEEWPALLDAPQGDDAHAALCALWDVFSDFPWETEAGPYVAISALLTLVARTAVEGSVPVFVFDANSPASGKTLVADTIATIALGREAGRHSYPTDPRGSNEEVSKALCAYALGGARLITWDNLSPDNVFGGPALESVATARDTASFRLLGKSDASAQIQVPWRAVMIGTGNNVAISRDFERRCLVPRFLSRWETADQRPLETFRHPERYGRLVAWARSQRIELVGHALTLLRAYHLAGRPSQGLRWASFDEWTELVPSAIVWAGGQSPLSARPADTGRGSTERDALTVILRDWEKVDPTGEGVTMASVVASLWPDMRPGEQRPPDGCDDLRDALETLAPPRGGRAPDKIRLAGAFRRVRQVVVAGRSIESVSGRAGVARWRVIGTS